MRTRPLHTAQTTGSPRAACRRRAFTLIELLVVLAIIGALAALSVPAFKGFGQANKLAAAERQILDDIGLARQYAIKNRATVYMVFAVPQTPNTPNGFDFAAANFRTLHNTLVNDSLLRNSYPDTRERALRAATNLFSGLFTSYALFTKSGVGEQPGVERPKYLMDWKSLPDGVVFTTNMTVTIPPGQVPNFPVADYPNYIAQLPTALFPVPVAPKLGEPANLIPLVNELPLPFLAFDPTGRLALVDANGIPVGNGVLPPDQFLAIGLGSVIVPRINPPPPPGGQERKYAGRPDFSRAVDFVETPKNNYTNSLIRVFALTGRAKLYKPKLQ